MSRTKIAITVEAEVLARIDVLVSRKIFQNRSRAIQQAIEEKLDRLEKRRLSEQCAMLDPGLEKAMAEEGLSEELADWPEY